MRYIGLGLLFVALLLSVPTALIASPLDLGPQIVPGVRVGPVWLGMDYRAALSAEKAFEAKTGCPIDLQFAGGKVIAAGTSWGGCLTLQVPAGAPMMTIETPFGPQVIAPQLDASIVPFMVPFGDPEFVTKLPYNGIAVIWDNGLAVYATPTKTDLAVTYIAVVPFAHFSVPGVGYFLPWVADSSIHGWREGQGFTRNTAPWQ